jgi:hypothetical protein
LRSTVPRGSVEFAEQTADELLTVKPTQFVMFAYVDPFVEYSKLTVPVAPEVRFAVIVTGFV